MPSMAFSQAGFAGVKLPRTPPLRAGALQLAPGNRGILQVGTWLSLVEHSLGVRGVGSSNLPVPTILLFLPSRR